jgi:hypothetical protein
VRSHVASCSRCQRCERELALTVSLAQQVALPPLPPGFTRDLALRIAASGPPARSLTDRLRGLLARRPFVTLATAACGGAALALVVAQAGARLHAATPAAISYAMPSNQIALVRVEFIADAPIDQVDFEVLLPDGLHFFAQGEEVAERAFQWQGSLRAGSNIIPVAVRGARPGRYHLIAHAVAKDLDVLHRVEIEVRS